MAACRHFRPYLLGLAGCAVLVAPLGETSNNRPDVPSGPGLFTGEAGKWVNTRR